MTIEEKAKAYDEAKARMSKAYNDNRCSLYFMNEIFPEPKVLKDEEMKLTIIQFLEYASSYGCPDILSKKKAKTWIAWLEKQGESKFEQCIQEGDEIVTNEDETHFNISQLERVATKESKFKAGDWVITDKGDTVQIGAVNNGYYTLYNGMDFNMSYVDKCWHRWTIEDAKDGDVLHSIGWHNDCIFIFNGLDNWRFDEPNGDRAVATGYCCLFVSADKIEFGIQGPDCIEVDSVKPATREQRDLLFQRMKEAGYMWDAEKKELKKVEKKPTEWDEDYDKKISELKTFIAKCNGFNRKNREIAFSMIDSLNTRSKWKPSSQHIAALEYQVHSTNEGSWQYRASKELLEQLKNL